MGFGCSADGFGRGTDTFGRGDVGYLNIEFLTLRWHKKKQKTSNDVPLLNTYRTRPVIAHTEMAVSCE